MRTKLTRPTADQLAQLGAVPRARLEPTIHDLKTLDRIAGHLDTIADAFSRVPGEHERRIRLQLKQDCAELGMLAGRIEAALERRDGAR